MNWAEANKRYLTAALALAQQDLLRRAGRATAADLAAAAAELQAAAGELPGPAALTHLCGAFSLSAFERGVLLLCAGVELAQGFPDACATLQGGTERRPYPTFALALAALPEPHLSAISPTAPLRRHRLIEIAGGEPLLHAPLRLDERVLHHLLGVPALDERLIPLCEPLLAPPQLQPGHGGAVARMAAALLDAADPPVIQLLGGDALGKRHAAAAACAQAARPLYLSRAALWPQAVAEREALCRLWQREALLSGAVLLLSCDEVEDPRVLAPLLHALPAPLLISHAEPLRSEERKVLRLSFDRPGYAEQRALWQGALGPLARRANGQIDQLASAFNLGLPAIAAACQAARIDAGEAEGRAVEIGALMAGLWDACRLQARARQDSLAQRIEPMAGWEDLVLPPEQREILRDLVAHVRQRARVYEGWGFARKSTRGLGITALFSGISGTGKTLAAEVLAGELSLDLYRIDLSQVVNKYIGETEKNLRRVFDAAEEGGAILLFDEADALFGKRSEVRDSHDRYANIEVSYLLQRMEQYRGLAILTTNLKNALDPAFLRRLRFVVQFPFPDTTQRAEIARRSFPTEAPTEGLDPSRLAQLNITGGSIRNIALAAAFLAADRGEPVRMAHVLRAARGEYAKLERPLSTEEVRGWA